MKNAWQWADTLFDSSNQLLEILRDWIRRKAWNVKFYPAELMHDCTNNLDLEWAQLPDQNMKSINLA